MTRNTIPLMIMMVALAACHSTEPSTEYVEYVEYADEMEWTPVVQPCDVTPTVSSVKYSVPRDGDLILETRHHVIQIQGAPNTAYDYQVWAGDKTYADDPDLIVNDGDVMVLQSE